MARTRDAIYTATRHTTFTDGDVADSLLALIDECGLARVEAVMRRITLKGMRQNGSRVEFELDNLTRDWFITQE